MKNIKTYKIFENNKQEYYNKILRLKDDMEELGKNVKLDIDECMIYLTDDYEHKKSSIERNTDYGISMIYQLFCDQKNVKEFIEELETAERRINHLGFNMRLDVHVIAKKLSDEKSYNSISINQFEYITQKVFDIISFYVKVVIN